MQQRPVCPLCVGVRVFRYVHGQLNANFNLRIFFGWQLFGLVQSLLVFFIPYGCYAHVSTRADGLMTDMWSFGTLIMTVICVVVNVGMQSDPFLSPSADFDALAQTNGRAHRLAFIRPPSFCGRQCWHSRRASGRSSTTSRSGRASSSGSSSSSSTQSWRCPAPNTHPRAHSLTQPGFPGWHRSRAARPPADNPNGRGSPVPFRSVTWRGAAWQPGAMGKLDSSDNMYAVFFALASGVTFWLTVIVTVRRIPRSRALNNARALDARAMSHGARDWSARSLRRARRY